MYNKTFNQLKQVIVITMIAMLLANGHIVIAAEKDTAPPYITLDHNYNPVANKSLLLQAEVGDSDGVKKVNLFYRLAGSETYKVLPIEKGEKNIYKVTIPKVLYPGVEFYIEATDMSGNKSSDGSASAPYMVSVTKPNICNNKKWLCAAAVSLVVGVILLWPSDTERSDPDTGSAIATW